MAFDFPSSPSVGQSYQGYTWDGEKWAVSASGGKMQRFIYTPAAGTTVLSGADAAGLTLAYTPGAVEVVINGLWVPYTDYTATNGTSITLGAATAAGDLIYVYALSNMSVLDAVSLNYAQSNTAAQKLQARTNIAAPLKGQLYGLTLSTAGSSTTFSIAAGEAADSTGADLLVSAASSKTTGAWAVGSGNGALDTSSIAASTWYHVFIIKRADTGVVDFLISLSATAPTLPTNYTLFRRIGSMKTNGSSQWTRFFQIGDEFIWDVPVLDQNGAAINTTPALYATSVPTGLSVRQRGNYAITSTATASVLVYSALLASAQASGTPSGNAQLYNPTAGTFFANIEMITNTSAQVMAVCSTATGTTFFIVTTGWIDRRGRDA